MTFTLADGTPMHLLDALDMYAGQVADRPEDVAVCLRYANTLRTLGYLDEAADQYQAVLDRDANQLEAWLNLAAIHVTHKRKKPPALCFRNWWPMQAKAAIPGGMAGRSTRRISWMVWNHSNP